MNKYIKFLITTIVTFFIMITLEYFFEGNFNIKSNFCYALVFFIVQILFDKIFSSKE